MNNSTQMEPTIAEIRDTRSGVPAFTNETLDVSLRKRYAARGGVSVQVEATFQAAPGVTILLGHSGAGKTTLLRCVAGLCDPDQGRIAIGERVLFDRKRNINVGTAQRKVGFVFQDLALFPHLTVGGNVGYGLRRLIPEEREKRITGILESFQIGHLAKRFPREISGGEQQRVALARSLVIKPAVLLLDEPLSSLDIRTKSAIIEDLQAWNEAHRIPILHVTHDHSEVFALGDRVLILDQGRIVSQGSPLEMVPTKHREIMAQAVGFENVFDTTVTGLDEQDETMTCRVAGTSIQLVAPLTRAAVGSAVRVGIRANEILIASARPEIVSTCTMIHGYVTRLRRVGTNTEIHIDCGAEVRVHLPARSADLAGLKVAGECWLIIRPQACHLIRKNRLGPLQRLFIFVCSGNTSRSPIAKAICDARIAERLKVPLETLEALGIRAISAGLSAKPGEPMTSEAQRALAKMGITNFEHKSQNLTAELASKAEVIFCMTSKQRETAIGMFPQYAEKISCMQPEADLEDPSGGGPEVFLKLAQQIEILVHRHMDDLLGMSQHLDLNIAPPIASKA